MDRLFGVAFAGASLAMFAMVILYVAVLAPGTPEGDWLVRLEYLREHWSLYATHWRIEFLAVAVTACAALHFARDDRMWLPVALGHLFYLGEYPLMLAGYPHADSEGTFVLLNEMATFVFTAANLLWLLGMIGVYARAEGAYRYVGTGLATVGAAASLGLFLDLLGMEQAAAGAVPMLLLYLVNAWYGLRVLARRTAAPRRGATAR